MTQRMTTPKECSFQKISVLPSLLMYAIICWQLQVEAILRKQLGFCSPPNAAVSMKSMPAAMLQMVDGQDGKAIGLPPLVEKIAHVDRHKIKFRLAVNEWPEQARTQVGTLQ